MQNDTELIKLIEQAASMASVLSPINISEVEELQKILNQINQTVVETDGCTNQLFQQIKGTTSDAAELLQKVLEKQVADTDKSIKTVLQAVSALQDLIDRIAQQAPAADSQSNQKDLSANSEIDVQKDTVISEEDVSLILDFIAESIEHINSAEAALLELETKPDDGDKELLNRILRAFHTIKGLAGFLNLTDVGSLAHAAESLLDQTRKSQLNLAGESIDVLFESISMMKEMGAGLSEAIETHKPVPEQKYLPQLLGKLKTAAEGQTLAASLESPEGQKRDEKIDEILAAADVGKPGDMASQVTAKAETVSGDGKIKVSTDRLDNLINMSGELVIAQSIVAGKVNKSLGSEHSLCSKVAHEGKIVRELQELSMSMRMVPIHGAFQKMARLVRDLSHKAGKKINFVTVGEETELDRSIVDKIVDPLLHMARNSVDHGIEPPEEREKVGKNPVGRIELRAFHQAGNVVIEIDDDGRGLNKERILKKAIESGIIKAGRELNDQEIFELIFAAGFSTVENVTDVSGRGVGMDVVKKDIESLRGKIYTNSTTGKGTTFTVRMPLTLAIIDGQIVKVGDERYIIPIHSVLRSFKPTLKQLSSVQNRGEIVMVRGQLIPVVRLYKLFDVVPKGEDVTESLLVIVEEGSERCCLLVDELLDQQQVVIKNLGKDLGRVKGISGGAIMGDGKVSLILDIPGLIELAQK
ncbi:MAG: chemotaxis protein CheA [Planctomycetota bacterium]|jgi:two-component system chemotaxis sensor kinase CheA